MRPGPPLLTLDLRRAFHATFPGQPRFLRRLRSALEAREGHRTLLRAAKVQKLGDPHRIANLLTHVRANLHGLYGADRLWPHLSPQARLVAVHGSGAVEKHIGIVLCRRFKDRGTRWTWTGANRLLKLRLRELQVA